MTPKYFVFKDNSKDTIEFGTNSMDFFLDKDDNNLCPVSQDVIAHFAEVSISSEMRDLLNLALFVYTIDQTVSRAKNGYLSWSRHLKCSFPVSDLEHWNRVKDKIEVLLSFLSGDKWEFVFRNRGVAETTVYTPLNDKNLTEVCLFSGGMDSFIGAIDLLESGKKIALVGHYKKGSPEHKTQETLEKAFQNTYGETSFELNQFYVQPNQKYPNAEKEGSSRARSFLFIVLGVAKANSLGTLSLIIPENGLISLNVPLTSTRLGSHSTRTTHPFYLHTFQEILRGLKIHNEIHNPYLFLTKGEMVEQCKNADFFKAFFQKTISCSHPDVGRFHKVSPNQHCGYCTPCIIRRAALKYVDMQDDFYVIDILKNPPLQTQKRGSDYHSFKMAVANLKKRNPNHTLFHIMKSGALSFLGQKALTDLKEMYIRGMEEVENLIF